MKIKMLNILKNIILKSIIKPNSIMLHRWSTIINEPYNVRIKNCEEKIKSCSSLLWCDYSYVEKIDKK